MFSLTRRRILGLAASFFAGIVGYCTGFGEQWNKNVSDDCEVNYIYDTYGGYSYNNSAECDIDLGSRPKPSMSRESFLSETFFQKLTNRNKS